MSEQPEICSLCLGGDTDVPPFGSLDDARDLIHPCSTCSIVVHRKCLLDWFNASPSDKLRIFEPTSLEDSTHELVSTSNVRPGPVHNDLEIGHPSDTTDIRINLSTNNLNNWVTSLMNPSNPLLPANRRSTVFILAPCPQCKNEIVFSMKRSPVLTFNTGVRSMLSKGLQYSGLFLGVTSAVTGVVSMGYIALTSCGLKMMNGIVPEPILVKMLTKNAASQSSLSMLSSLLVNTTNNTNNYGLDNLETALSRGLIDPFKFSRIPILPIILYRMRQSSFVQCVFQNFHKEVKLSNWFAEFMISGYISSLGNHQLARIVYQNVLNNVSSVIRNPLTFYKYLNVFKGVDFWNTNNMISMLIPARILYDLLFRVTLNQLHFDIAMKVRPRTIANNMPEHEFDEFELLNNKLNNIRILLKDYTTPKKDEDSLSQWINSKVNVLKTLFKDGLILKYIRLKVYLSMLKAKACLKDDYSETFSYRSFTLRCLTTVAWPFVSSKLGSFVNAVISKGINSRVPQENVMFLSNLIALVLVVLAKDIVNVYITNQKKNQLAKLSVINFDSNADLEVVFGSQTDLATEIQDINRELEEFTTTSFPGGFEIDMY
ncbi:hypothetical protein PSN45_005206 [Yamadazyma tenuis]|uniref:RING-CH-type domain-containing protein n=1 Tax=Candida tenuis (strain ATCC 10573 / BCRC 21748 / CBS 615 / JCM 9827 / NBRC 10315 / NRRL Y-1498 / VKM Y-70) TaxID=590646 RepID=G3B111_CANTC|nr:uncharacterized protein CANTEDRAFT_113621 [Yamadazyma tenuis ATCC 10573]EGV64856.1 hypothetical protein CANTEDRAFT_113621 [Yamadazyma tenuis ATCC 10573]WEJ97649.1 hypothetical protein PSN45_005206 [Yamadazyma tenuis]